MFSPTKDTYYKNIFKNVRPCSHCYNNHCSSDLALSTQMTPIYMEDNKHPTRSIDINILVIRLPHEILIKIYNDYIRTHKFAQLFKLITNDTIYNNRWLHNIDKIEFIKHFHIFLYTPIRKYIMSIDREFNTVVTSLIDRNYNSAFVMISNLKISIFLEILMTKYH